MHTVTLSDKEIIHLRNLLKSSISDLRAEIAHTDSPFFKDELRNDKETLGHIETMLHEPDGVSREFVIMGHH